MLNKKKYLFSNFSALKMAIVWCDDNLHSQNCLVVDCKLRIMWLKGLNAWQTPHERHLSW